MISQLKNLYIKLSLSFVLLVFTSFFCKAQYDITGSTSVATFSSYTYSVNGGDDFIIEYSKGFDFGINDGVPIVSTTWSANKGMVF